MSIQQLISNYSSYNEWANAKTTAWLNTIEKELLTKQTPSSFTSIALTLQHIIRGQKFWLVFISGEDITNFNWKATDGEVENLVNELNIVSTKMKLKFSSFTEEELHHKLELDTRWIKNKLSRYEYIMHVINHSTYHRGQIVTMARTLGINEGIGNTDYNFFC